MEYFIVINILEYFIIWKNIILSEINKLYRSVFLVFYIYINLYIYEYIKKI